MEDTTSPQRDFWSVAAGFDGIDVRIDAAEKPLELLGKLGPAPFERGGFPVIGFLATTYDKVARAAAQRR
jgi:hypothetical protein